jgi:hypothetical protein
MDSVELSKLIKQYYSLPGNLAGGNCHVVLDDNNIDDSSIERCIEICQIENDDLGLLIMRHMRSMRKTARGKSIYYANKGDDE